MQRTCTYTLLQPHLCSNKHVKHATRCTIYQPKTFDGIPEHDVVAKTNLNRRHPRVNQHFHILARHTPHIPKPSRDTQTRVLPGQISSSHNNNKRPVMHGRLLRINMVVATATVRFLPQPQTLYLEPKTLNPKS